MDDPLDAELLAEVTARAKKQIRARMRQVRQGHPRAALEKRSALICSCLEQELAEVASVALFWPLVPRGEVDLRDLDRRLRERGCKVYYPFMDPKPDGGYLTGFRLTEACSELVDLGQGFWEPRRDAPVAARGDVDAVVVPALAVDGRGHRIGYGAGYYDATLGDLCPPARSILVAYDFQLLAELPHEPHDKACDVVLTDQRRLTSGPDPTPATPAPG